MSKFVHLRTHTEYSIDDGLIRTGDLVSMAAADGQPAVAMTDNNKMFGVINFYNEARSAGVKPVIGADVWVDADVTGGEGSSPVRLLLLCQGVEGYRQLMGWLSRAYLSNQKNGVAAIKQSWMLEEPCRELIALTGDHRTGEIGSALLSGDNERLERALEFYTGVFNDRLYLEVQRAGFDKEDEWVQKTVDLAASRRLPVCATHPIQFANRSDYFSHEVKTCIQTGEAVEDIARKSLFTREQCFQSAAQMEDLFSDIPEALANAGEIARRCSLTIPLHINALPEFVPESGEPLVDFFVRKSREGLEERLVYLYPDAAERAARRGEYDHRLDHEIRVVTDMGFPGYFMIVSDFIVWAKDNGIPVGPGRGSGAGSLVAYSLKITDLDPLKYGLLFERFLNPDRVSMPDFDVDFEAERRGEVIEYVREKYGKGAVSQIATLGTLKAKAALKGVGRALQYNYTLMDTISKLIPSGPSNLDITLEEALEMEPRLKDKYDKDKAIRRLFDVAMRIEGLPSTIGVGPAGVVIAPGKISDFAPLYLADDNSGVVTQYDIKQVEAAGLVKFDFLGVKVLTLLDKTIQLVNRRPEFKDKPLQISSLPLDDNKVYKALSEGNSVGVFQFEGAGMQGMLRRAQPACFEDLIALIALYRPGPMELIPDFIRRKQGEKFEYPHPTLEHVLKETYGIMVYQEQVMQTAQVIAGYSLGQADILRRAMGKKKPEEMAAQRAVFAEGAMKNGLTRQQADQMFNTIETFAGYGFNKSHAAAYALIAYQTAYFKVNYPAEHLASFLNVEIDNTDKLEVFIKDGRINGIEVLPPDINSGTEYFTPVSDRQIRYGLHGLKGVGSPPIKAIEEVRERDGLFTSFFDFCKKTGRSKVPKTATQALIRAGAFDSINPDRNSVFASMDDGLSYAGKLAKEKQKTESILPELFGPGKKPGKKTKRKADQPVEEPMMTVPQNGWNDLERLSQEKIAMGFYFSGHPSDGFKKQLGGLLASTPLFEVDRITAGSENRLVAGVISKLKVHTPKSGNKMAFVTLDDGYKTKDITMFSDVYVECQNWLKEGVFVAFEAKVEPDRRGPENGNSMLAEQAFSFEDLQSRLATSIHVALPGERITELVGIVKKHPGLSPVHVYHPEQDGTDMYLRAKLPEKLGVTLTPECVQELRQIFGNDKTVLDFAKQIVFEKRARRRPSVKKF